MNQAASATIQTDARRIETLLQLAVACLVVLGTLLLSMGQQSLYYAIAALIVAGVAFFVTDLKGYFALGPNATTVVALGSCCVLVWQVIRNIDQSQLLNVSNVLIYLEAILLFQKKLDRTYWSLMALSLLQVIVASALNLGLLFGVLLAVYLLVATTALALFYVHREGRAFRGRIEPTGMNDAGRNRRVLIASGHEDPASRMLTPSYWKFLGYTLLITTVGTSGMFFAIPRFNNSVWQADQQGQVNTVGFTEEVGLNDIGRILESPEQVMRVEFIGPNGEPYHVDGDPYFRGTVLSIYRDDSWHQFTGLDRTKSAIREIRPPTGEPLVRQTITLQPGSHSVLFNIAPCYAVANTDPDLRVIRHSLRLTLDEDENPTQRAPSYELGTTAFRNGWQKDLLPALYPAGGFGDPMMQPVEAQWIQKYPVVYDTARTVLEDQGLLDAPIFQRAKALEAHLRNSGLYRYSLERRPPPDPARDPIEAFLADYRTGHCEYFASALALMLRSQQIPARLVVGYMGGDYNTLGGYYVVRQLHAHAWVECFLEPEQIPEDERDILASSRYGAYLRLDPTPSGLDVVADQSRFPFITTIREFVDYLQVLWDDYVLGLNSSRQRQAIYGPLIRNTRAVFTALFSPAAWQARVARLGQWGSRLAQGDPLSWTIAVLLSTAIVMFYFARRWLWQRVRMPFEWMKKRRGLRRELVGRRLDIYDQMEKLLRRFGMSRHPTQTQVEFARVASGQLTRLPQCRHVADTPKRIAQAFYRVRFGNQTLDANESRQLKHALSSLEKALK